MYNLLCVQSKSAQILNVLHLSFVLVNLLQDGSEHSCPIKHYAPANCNEVEKLQRQRIASFIGHVFQLTFAAMVDKLIQHPSRSTL